MLLTEGVVGAAPTAGADTITTSTGLPRPVEIHAGGEAGQLAGYFDSLTTDTVTATLEVNVPTVDCSTPGISPNGATFVQAFINGSQGTTATVSGLLISGGCSGTTTPMYQTVLLIDGNDGPTLAASPGDVLKFTASTKVDSETYTLKDLSRSAQVSATGSGMNPSGLQTTVEGSPYTGGFPRFSTVTYSHFKVDGRPYSIQRPARLKQVDGSGHTMIKASALSNAGNSFKVTYVSNA
jgi:hypothetical protein